MEKSLDITAFSLSPLIGNICTGSISDAEDNHYKECLYNVIGIDGDPECGGKNVDTAIYDYLLKQIEDKYKKPLTALYQRQLRKKIEEVKVHLSEDDEDDE